MKTDAKGDVLCSYCEMPIDEPTIVLRTVDYKILGLKLFTKYYEGLVHKECSGHYKLDKQSMFIANISVVLGIIAVILGIIALMK